MGHQTASEPESAETSPRSTALPKRILVADDNPVVRSVVRLLLEAKGFYVCGEADDGLNVVQQANDLTPDLVVLDLRMPGLTGIEAASVIKKALPHVRIVLFTMYEQSVSKTTTSAAHIDLVLSKPDGMGTLLDSIEDLLGPA